MNYNEYDDQIVRKKIPKIISNIDPNNPAKSKNTGNHINTLFNFLPVLLLILVFYRPRHARIISS